MGKLEESRIREEFSKAVLNAHDIVSGKKPRTMVYLTKSKNFYELAERWIENNA